jgi:hypothetical protein
VEAITNVADLLKADESCAKESETVFAVLGSSALECANAGLRVFASVAKWVRNWEENHASNDAFNKTAEELGLSGQQLYEIVCGPPDPSGEDPRITKARGINTGVSDALARRTLLQLLWRAYGWGLTDLRRLKLTATAGYMRVEAESVALLLLFQERPDLGERWLNPEENLVKFFQDTQGELQKILDKHKLTMAYENGSAVAQHARFASASRGVRVNAGDVQVLDREFDPEQPASFHLGLAYFLRLQKRFFHLLPNVFDGLQDDEEFKTVLAEFISLEEKTWWVMERKYETEIKAFYLE